MNKKHTNLEERLIKFAVSIIKFIDEIPNTKVGNHLSGQLIRSGTSPALNYGEARRAESKKDFVHKLQVVLKELGESLVTLKILHLSKLYESEQKITALLVECDELVAIFVSSVNTAKHRKFK